MADVASRHTQSTMSPPRDIKSQLRSESENPQQPLPTIRQPEDPKPVVDHKDAAASTTNAPLAPPPRPTQNGADGDYFNAGHTGHGTHLTKEPNPFESAFGNPVETPGKTQLPGVTSLTSPAPLLPGNTPGWAGSLRSGPLSPAMLTGPTGGNDYFSNDHFAGSFPTPNESSLRTGLTPGGGGSMFPQPSPNSQAIFNAIQSGGATPGTLDFHRTAMHARAASQPNNNFAMPQPTSQPQDPNIQPNLDSKGFGPQRENDPFEQHDANDAANGLFLLAQARSNRGGQPQAYPPPQQQSQMPYMGNSGHMSNQMGQQSHENSPHMGNRAAKNSITSNMSGSTQNDQGDFSESGGSEETKPQRTRGKKGSNANVKAPSTGRRKADDTPAKGNKRQKGNNGGAIMPEDDMESDDDDENKLGQDGKKMTDEEKRKNFLERNRVAALKCRQRKKQWLANLQQKVEIFSTENDALAATVTQLREEIVGLKTLLLAHKECPVSQAQGISGMAMQNIAGEPHQFANPYGMAMQGMPQQAMQQGNMQRR
ncbi:Aft1 HRA domain-containing protein [Delphinella strobiligena]|nr:Aft1 HRA domain-containing protein [Delphinella strobiligena]